MQDAKNILLRQAAAAYLNSLSIAYAFTTSEVVDMVNDALERVTETRSST